MKILVVDDDAELQSILTLALARAGFQVTTASDGDEALKQWQSTQPNLIVLDLSMPHRSGLNVLEQVRKASSIPIIVLTVRDNEEDIVRAFELGADDYVTKPYSPRQLIARIQARLRRAGAQEHATVTVGDAQLDVVRHELRAGDGVAVHLTPLETRLLEVLMSAAGEPFSPPVLIERVWGYDDQVADQTLLKTLVRRVRIKIEPDPRQPRYLKTLLGVGYVFARQRE